MEAVRILEPPRDTDLGRVLPHGCLVGTVQSLPESSVVLSPPGTPYLPGAFFLRTHMADDHPSPPTPWPDRHALDETPLGQTPPAPPLETFGKTLRRLTPRVWATPLLVEANILLFALMVLWGVNPLMPKPEQVIAWGGNFGPRTLDGQEWRLVACCFLHFGLLHLGLNMWVLSTAGPLVERMLGNLGFLILYLAAGVGGSLASVTWHPMAVGAGASGAVFGVYGALLALLLRAHRSIPSAAVTPLRNSGLAFVGGSLFIGATQPGIDNAAHIGGLVTGFGIGLVMAQPLVDSAVPRRLVRNLLALCVAAMVLSWDSELVHSKHAGLLGTRRAILHFAEVEERVLNELNAATERFNQGELVGAEFTKLVEEQTLPPWREAVEELEADRPGTPSLERDRARAWARYGRLREQSWLTLVQAVRADDRALLDRFHAEQQAADQAAQTIGQ